MVDILIIFFFNPAAGVQEEMSHCKAEVSEEYYALSG